MGTIVDQEVYMTSVGSESGWGFQLGNVVTSQTWQTNNLANSRRDFAGIWEALPIGQGATIDSATITFNYAASSGTNWLKMHCWDQDQVDDLDVMVDTATMKGDGDVTTAVVNVPGLGTAGVLESGDLKTLIQEVVDRVGWVYGNSLGFWGEANTSTSRSNQFYSVAHLTENPPLLNVAWTGGVEPAVGGGGRGKAMGRGRQTKAGLFLPGNLGAGEIQ